MLLRSGLILWYHKICYHKICIVSMSSIKILITASIIAAAAVGLYYVCKKVGYSVSSGQLNSSLYDRLGGIYNIAAVVNHFSDALINNPVVGIHSKNIQLQEWSINNMKANSPTGVGRLPGLKFMRTLWLASIAGGPYKYTPTKPGKCPFSLENAHASLKISPQEFDAVAEELSNSLDYFKVPVKEKQEVLSVFAAHKPEINKGFYTSKGIQTPAPKCPFGF